MFVRGKRISPLSVPINFIAVLTGIGAGIGLGIATGKAVEGVSRQHGSKLKLDCHIYREYFFIKNGNLKQRMLFCQLSSKLKQKMKSF